MKGLYNLAVTYNKSNLWAQFGGLVRHEALKLQARLPAGVELDDLMQAGAIAVMNAVDQFDPSMGVKLKVFLAQRVRWAFIDELRENDWAPRRIRRKSREVSAAIARVEQRTGNAATEQEVAAELEMSLQDYQTVLQETNSSLICSLDELMEDGGEGFELSECQTDEENPLNDILRKDLMQKISEEIQLLPEREQFLLNLYYQQDLNMKEIGLLLSVTETRISQLHSQIIKRLRARLEMHADINLQ
ncbi:RNA polymerase sigma factor FliA [Escherichia sp. E2748]|uniref:RNA polymerase sigma factor FliA n=1 Tax=unclassified Escherichia TaxID=2608889 RepID=UPI0010817B66|nr:MULTISPECIES: RNA polymerase sigma factor FliA [unclassified Escherichia]TGC21321.1 RNA polymerase sigma factor FliA [Escherichia sp. E1130]TLI73265.1 RNA polymerase sigma factor FliA [Escherichia sp. E1130]TLI85179.1 RNA polymerase sigma factor FliA [Escherichia sp. E2748]